MAGVRNIARNLPLSSHSTRALQSAASVRALHTSPARQEAGKKGVFGWLRGDEAAPQEGSAAAGPATATAPSAARAQAKSQAQVDAAAATTVGGKTLPRTAKSANNESSTKRQQRLATDRTVAAEKHLSLRRGTVWPRFKNAPRPAVQKNPRNYPPTLDFLLDNSHKLSAEERSERFEALLTHVADHVGRKPTVDDAIQLRDSSWNQLVQLATNSEQLERVAEQMPHWVDMKRDFKPAFWSLFIERAHQVDATPFALRILLDHSKYGIKLPSLDAVSGIIRSSMQSKYEPDAKTLSNLVALVAVARQQQLPALASHLRATVHFMAALLDTRAISASSKTVAHALLPSLHQMVLTQHTLPATWRKELKMPLAALQTHLTQEGLLARWLWTFRVHNGLHLQGETSAEVGAVLKEASKLRKEAYAGLPEASELFHVPGVKAVRGTDARKPENWVPRESLKGEALDEATRQTRAVLRMRVEREAKRRVEALAKQEVAVDLALPGQPLVEETLRA